MAIVSNDKLVHHPAKTSPCLVPATWLTATHYSHGDGIFLVDEYKVRHQGDCVLPMKWAWIPVDVIGEGE